VNGSGLCFSACLVIALSVSEAAYGQGEKAGPRLDADFSQAPLAERRDLARAAREAPLAEHFRGVRAALSDPDAEVRVELLGLCAALDLTDAESALRLALFRGLAQDDEALSVRRAALMSLAGLDSSEAARALADLVLELAPSERAQAAREQVSFARGRELAFDTVRDSFASPRAMQALPSDVLTVLFSVYGTTLAERPGGGDLALERAPFVLGLTHNQPMLRAAAAAALDDCLLRLRELERSSRAARLLEALANDGVEARAILYLRLRSALAEGGGNPEEVIAQARDLRRTRGGPDTWIAQRWRFRALYLEGMALLALDRTGEARELFSRAGDLQDGLLEARVDLAGQGGAIEQRDLLHERSLLVFARAFAKQSGGTPARDLGLLEDLRLAHELQLEAQLVATAGDAPIFASLGTLYDSQLGPYQLIFALRPHAAWPPSRCLELESALGRGLASVSAREVPGFNAFADLPDRVRDPLLDSRRRTLLGEIAVAEVQALQRRIDALHRRMDGGGDDAALENEAIQLALGLRMRAQDLREKSLEQRFFDLRMVAALALRHCGGLRREGDTEACRALAAGFVAELDQGNLPAQYPWAVRLVAQGHLLLGGTWSDDDEAQEAETEMLAALELFKGLETYYKDRGAPAAAAQATASMADALVSLAVNANVKQRDAEAALAYFERAFSLQEDDFMRILLACYRARSGRVEEAHALLAEIPVSPRGYYNLACTYALLGEGTRALELLAQDFRENRRSPAALARQQAWARADPDLASLRGDARFESLTEIAPEAGTGER